MMIVVPLFPSAIRGLVVVTVTVKVSDTSNTESSVMLTPVQRVTLSVELVAGKVRVEDTAV